MNRPEAALDIECFHNWFLVGFTDATTGQEWDFQMVEGGPLLDVASIDQLLRHYTVITFNGVNYDIPMLMLALQGADCAQLKAANDAIIVGGLKWWAFYKAFGCYPPDYIDHIDVMEPTPGVRVSLKQYACRLHAPLVQDSPVDFKVPIQLAHIPQEIAYCRNDRRVTLQLRTAIADRLDLRIGLSEQYGVDLRSKSDAQMAEAMVKVEWSRRLAAEIDNLTPSVFDYDVGYDGTYKPNIPKYAHGTTFKAILPDYLSFVTPYMQQVHALVAATDFMLTDKDEAELLSDGTEVLDSDG
jgi:hypothetical protein